MNHSRPLRTVSQCALLCLLFTALDSHSQDILWEKSYGGKHADYLFDAVPTADYGFILAGSSLSGKTGNKSQANKGNLDYWVWKMDEKGEPVWQKSFGGDGIDLLQSIKLTSDGGFILAGSSNSSKGDDKKEDGRGDTDFWVIKLDAGGGEQWQKTIGGSSADDLVSVVQTQDGGYLLGGSSSSEATGDKTDKSRGNTDYWIVRLDASGNIKWQKTYGGPYADALRSIAVTADGGCIVGGYSNSTDAGDKTQKCYGAADFWILKLDGEGAVEWQQTFGGSKDDQLSTVFQTRDGDYIAGGSSNSDAGFNKKTSSRNGSDFWVIRLDAGGTSLWQQTYDFGKYDVLTSLVENADGSFLLGGYAKSEALNGKDREGVNDYIALKITAAGDEVWDKTLGSEGSDVLRKLIETRDGGYILAGTSNPQREDKKAKSSAKHSPVKAGNGKQPAGLQKVQGTADAAKQDALDSANNYYKEQASSVTDAVNDAVGQGKDSPLQIGVNEPGDILGNGSSGNTVGVDPAGALSGIGQKKQPASKDKKDNLGKNDFWVVKLKDKDKKEKARQSVEAIPNPAYSYTNVIVGYEYEKGMATVYDINGRQMQRFAITDRTVPINLEGLPAGVYIVQIATNKSTDSVKVIKGNEKN